MRRVALVAIAAALLTLATTAHAGYPGSNGKIAFSRDGEIWTMNADGTGQVQLTTDASPSSEPEWSPDGTRILYTRGTSDLREVRVMNADGSGDAQVFGPPAHLAAYSPTWSPSGDQIAFLVRESVYGSLRAWTVWYVYIADPDGSNARRRLVAGAEDFRATDIEWSPRGDEIAYTSHTSEPNAYVNLKKVDPWADDRAVPGWDADTRRYAPAWSPNAEILGLLVDTRVPTSPEIAAVDLTGGQQTQLTDNGVEEYGLEWSPDGEHVVYSGQEPGCSVGCNPELHVMNPDGTGRVRLTSTAAAETAPDWQPLIDPPSRAPYVYPEAAARQKVSLVPAYGRCTTANRLHGPPLAFGSCNPTRAESPDLTVGTPDANGAAARMTGSASMQVIDEDPITPAGEADVRISIKVTDVRCRPGAFQCSAGANAEGGDDYRDHLRARLPLRVTDLYNMPAPGGDDPGTGDRVQELTIPCSGTESTAVGSTCEQTISLNAWLPGAVKTGRRAVVELGQIEVWDGTSDGTGFNEPSLFLRAGIFVP